MDVRPEDKRTAERVRTIFAGRAVIGAGFADVNCQVKDLSATGARIAVPERTVIPDHFELHIPTRGIESRVTVRWREGRMLGVTFAGEHHAQPGDQSARVRELEAEVRDLRRRLAEMSARLFSYGDSERPVA